MEMRKEEIEMDVLEGEFFIDGEGNPQPERRSVPRTATGAIIMSAPKEMLLLR